MKQMHRLIVTSETYKLATEVEPKLAAANAKIDSDATHFSGISGCSGWRPSRFGIPSSAAAGDLDSDRRRSVFRHSRSADGSVL